MRGKELSVQPHIHLFHERHLLLWLNIIQVEHLWVRVILLHLKKMEPLLQQMLTWKTILGRRENHFFTI